MKLDTRNVEHAFEVQVHLHEMNPGAVSVELYANSSFTHPAERHSMDCVKPVADTPGSYLYRVVVDASRADADYTARLIPYMDGVAIPLEESRILWQR